MGATDRVFGNPLHPYTRALLASVPQLHTRWADVPAVAPGTADDASGPLVQVEDDHFVASAVAA
jgi:peptide/nickel transport system ATP-binding protein